MKVCLKKTLLTPQNIIFLLFVAAEIIIYAVFNALALAGKPDPIFLKYGGVLLCLTFISVMLYFTRMEADCIILTCALVFTAISDLFILVMDDYYEVGLVTFIITQSIYFYRMYRGRLKKIIISASVRAATAIALIVALACTSGANFLIVEVCIYITMLFVNCIDAAVISGRGVSNVLFAVGLVLFLGCDICVGLHNGAMVGISLTPSAHSFVGKAIWAFYLPSQVLIVLSLKGGIFSRKVQNGSQGQTPS